jgi:flagellar hook-associated protein 1 FlgK
VSLDEEAANLIQYQQLYSANAQVINVAREIFDQLLNSL